MNAIIPVPADFNFDFSLEFLRRSPREILHKVTDDGSVTKVLRTGDELTVVSLTRHKEGILLSFPSGDPSPETLTSLVSYVREWFDLDSDLKPFYKIASKDKILGPLAKKYRGHRIMSYPDLFESLIWAVLGQQINLQFAYTLKQRFVTAFGTCIQADGQVHYLFPLPEKIAGLQDTDLLPLQFSRQKSQYTVNIAKAFVAGEISKEKLKQLTFAEAREALMKIKGVGNWTANYALMRTFRYPNAFPLEDAGLHNALKKQLGLKTKPSLVRVKKIFSNYKGWEAYATVYLWKSL
jgi:DNA-3-methyladenine glycosylase II